MPQYQRRLETVQAEQFRAREKPWPKGVYAVPPGAAVLETADACIPQSPGDRDIPVYDGDWIIRRADGSLTTMTDERFRNEFEPCAQGFV